MRRKQRLGLGISVASAILVVLAGCKKDGNDAKQEDAAKANVQARDNQGKTIAAQTTALRKRPKLLSFKEAVILDPVPEGEMQPANKTHTGKNAVKIFEAIANDLWDKDNGFFEGEELR